MTVPFVIFLHDFEGERQTGVLASEEIISAVAVSVNELLARVLKASITAMFILRINMKSPSDKTHRELSPGSAFPPLHSTQLHFSLCGFYGSQLNCFGSSLTGLINLVSSSCRQLKNSKIPLCTPVPAQHQNSRQIVSD